MAKKYFQPVPGKKYLNRNGVTYFCLQARSACSALFISLGSGYMLLAHQCSIYDDRTIDWLSSDGRGFYDTKEIVNAFGFDSSVVLEQ